MATIEQVKALLRMHYDENDEKFMTIALQIAAHEARNGHSSSANEIKNIIQNSKRASNKKVLKFIGKNDALDQKTTDVSIKDLILSEQLESKIERIIIEYKKKTLLRKSGLKNRSKILLSGPPGTGKTMTASVIAHSVNLPLFVIQIDRLVSKYMGETSVKLRQVFESIDEVAGVYLFDEFDAIGADRLLDNDVGEMRRILNTFLMHIENDDSNSIIIAATNNPGLLDKALFRRFDDVLEFALPMANEVERLLKKKLYGLSRDDVFCDALYIKLEGLSHADITKMCNDAIKQSILYDIEIDRYMIEGLIEEIKTAYSVQEA